MGLPALSLPIGGTGSRPGAVQIVAPDEETVLRVALELEQASATAYAATTFLSAS